MYSVSIIIFTAGLYVLFTAFTQISQEAILFIIIGAALSFMVAIMPTKYQIFSERIRIVHGWLFHFDIPFQNIENVTPAKWKDLWGLNLNFISGYSSYNILRIIRKRGPKIHITPGDRDLFLEHLNKALIDYGSYLKHYK
jgi:hypothetical protein